MSATPEQLALARNIAADHFENSCIMDQHGARQVREGMWDHWAEVQIALAAIIETSERAATYVERLPLHDISDSLEIAEAESNRDHAVMTALRSGEHLKGDGR